MNNWSNFNLLEEKKHTKNLFMYQIMVLYKLNIQVMQSGLDINSAD